jgi:two-component system, OmpR family, phosphate regulon sensor histidine kinase PhoR
LTFWILGAVLVVLALAAWRYVAGIIRLREGLLHVARGQLNIPLLLDLPRGLRAAERDLKSIAERLRELERAASHDRSGLDAILGSIFEGVFIVDRHLRIQRANPSIQTTFGLPASPAGRTVLEAFRSLEIHELVRRGLAAAGPQLGEIVLQEGPAQRVFELSVSPLVLEDGGEGAVVVVHDISKIKNLERVRREFVANVSHELRTPLTIINGYLETLIDDGLEDRALAASALQVMFKHGDRLKHLVDDLLTISHLESRSASLDLQQINVRDFFQRAVEHFDETIRAQGVQVRLSSDDDDLLLEADPPKLEQALFNLLENALKHGHRRDLTVVLHAEQAGPDVHLQVSDNGPGIPYEDQEHIFERFYRVHKHRSRETGGTGLGLSIVKNVVEAHGGTISLQSVPGAGCTFRLVLPASPRREPQENAQPPATPGVEPVVMKPPILPGVLCAALMFSAGVHASAQTPTPSPTPLGDKPGERGDKPSGKKHKQDKHGPPREDMAGLTPDEAKRLGDARKKAEQDSTVRSLLEARRAIDQQLESAMNAAILSADPSLAPVLEKVKGARGRAEGMRDRFKSLTEKERETLKTARDAAKDDPAVVAAREKLKSASTPEAKREAGRTMQEAMQAAMIKQNPALGPLLEKLGPPPPPPGMPPMDGGPGGPGGPPPPPPPGMEE